MHPNNSTVRTSPFQFIHPLSVGAALCFILFVSSCSQKCPENATEVNGNCECLAGYSGEECSVKDLCVINQPDCGIFPCENGQCQCSDGYTGENCKEFDIKALDATFKVISYFGEGPVSIESFSIADAELGTKVLDYTVQEGSRLHSGDVPGLYVRQANSWDSTALENELQLIFRYNITSFIWDEHSVLLRGVVLNDTLRANGSHEVRTWTRGGPKPGNSSYHDAGIVAVRVNE